MVAKRTFSWLHLTDLHVGMSIARNRWTNIEGSILEDLEKVMAFTRVPIDVIFFTGDLTFKGAAKEFEKFDEILDTIRTKLRTLGSDPTFVAVPGNHDLTRPPAGRATVEALRDLSTKQTVFNLFWTSSGSDYRKTVTTAFKNWTKWSDAAIDWNRFEDVKRDGLLPGDFAATWIDGGRDLRIGVLGLNTAALQLAAGDYKGCLSINVAQVDKLVDKLYVWKQQHDAVFLLTHHDPTWLDVAGNTEYDSELNPDGRFDVHLCGHLHVPKETLTQYGGDLPRRIYLGASLFGLEEYESIDKKGTTSKEKRYHGYTVGVIQFGKTRRLRRWPRENRSGATNQINIEAAPGMQDDQGTRPETLLPQNWHRVDPPPKSPSNPHGSGAPVLIPPAQPTVDTHPPTIAGQADEPVALVQRCGELAVVQVHDALLGHRWMARGQSQLTGLLRAGEPITGFVLSQDGRILVAQTGDQILVADVNDDLTLRRWTPTFSPPDQDFRVLAARRTGSAPELLVRAGNNTYRGRVDRGGEREWRRINLDRRTVASAFENGFAIVDPEGVIRTTAGIDKVPDVYTQPGWQGVDYAAGGGEVVIAAIGITDGVRRLVVMRGQWSAASTRQKPKPKTVTAGVRNPMAIWHLHLRESWDWVMVARTPTLDEVPRFVAVSGRGQLEAWDLDVIPPTLG